MKRRSIRAKRKAKWQWLFPIFFMAVALGIFTPAVIFLNNHNTFYIRLIQFLPVILLEFAAVMAVGIAVAFLVMHWERIKEVLGERFYLAYGILLALTFIAFVQNRYPSVVLLIWGLLAGMLLKKWEHKYVYMIYGVVLAAGIVFFVRHKYPLITVLVWGFVLAMLLNKSIAPIEVYTDVVFGLGLGVCVQILLSNNGLQALSNSQPNWDDQSTGAILSLHLWGLCMILPSVLRLIDEKLQIKVKKIGSIALSVCLIIGLGVYYFTVDRSPIAVITKDNEFELSSGENTVVFLVDSLDAQYVEDYVLPEDMRRQKDEEDDTEGKMSALLQMWLGALDQKEIASEEPEPYKLDEEIAHGLLDDFTYFDNVVSGAAPSWISLPTLFTGEKRTDYEDDAQFFKEAFAASSLFRDLQENGYSVKVYSGSSALMSADTENIDNIRTDIVFKDRSFAKSLKNMFRLSGYMALPYQMKGAFYTPGSDVSNNVEIATPEVVRYWNNDPQFYADYCENGLTLRDDRNCFVVYHLYGALLPLRMNEIGETAANDDTSMGQQLGGVFKIISDYIVEMKDKGIYDDSTIIIAGTNGDLELGQNPAVFIKQKHTSGDFARNSTPLTFANLRASLVDGIVDDAKAYGYNMFNQPAEAAPALRAHVAGRNYWQKLYSEDGAYYREFRIGDEATGQENILKTVELEPYPYELNEWISFSGFDSTKDFPITGLGIDEGTFCWTLGQDVTMGFVLEEPQDIVYFNMDYTGTIDDNQRVMAFVNDYPVYDEMARWHSSVRFAIPREYAPEGVYNIVLKLPNVVTPKELGINDDNRLLGLQVTGCALYSTLEYIHACPTDEWISLLVEDNLTDYSVNGLSGDEGGYQWTQGNGIRMLFRVDEPPKDAVFELNCEGVFAQSQRVQVNVNGHPVCDQLVEGASIIRGEIPKAYAPDGVYEISILLPDAVSPAELGISTDARTLALQLTDFRLSTKKSVE